jgi:peptidoglycan/xylan/chitin deacetylase (PgdA/CDA1 family)
MRRRRAADAVVLAYHNIVPDGAEVLGDRSLHLPQREFARQLDLLRETHDVVPLDQVLEPPSGPRTRPRAAITFDDACQGAVTAGIDELARRGMPATVFVAPAFVGGRSFWWDALAGPGTEGLAEDVRRHALESLAGRDDAVRRWAECSGIAVHAVPDHQTCATEAQLRALDGTEGITLASHTWSHPNLARLSREELEEELSRPLAWLRERFQHVIPWLTYPYGLASPQVVAAVAEAGYRGALLVEGGWLPRHPRGCIHPYELPRQNVPSGLSLRGFELRVSGFLTS